MITNELLQRHAAGGPEAPSNVQDGQKVETSISSSDDTQSLRQVLRTTFLPFEMYQQQYRFTPPRSQPRFLADRQQSRHKSARDLLLLASGGSSGGGGYSKSLHSGSEAYRMLHAAKQPHPAGASIHGLSSASGACRMTVDSMPR